MWVNLQGCWIPMTLVNSLLFSKLLFTRGANFRTVASPLLCQRRVFTCGPSATFYLWLECNTNLWPKCTTRSPGTAPPCVTAHRGIVEAVIVVVVPSFCVSSIVELVIVVVVPIFPIRVLSLLHSLVSEQWSQFRNPPRFGRDFFAKFSSQFSSP